MKIIRFEYYMPLVLHKLAYIILKHKHDASPVNLPSPTSVYNEELMNKIQENEMLHKQVRSLYIIWSSDRDIEKTVC